MTVARIISNICSDCLPETRNFYVEFLGFDVTFDSDWYIQVASPANPRLEIGFIRRDHELVPTAFQARPQGIFMTLVVESVDRIYARALERELAIVQPPKDEFYGQRRLLLTDPNGLLLDISTPIAST